MTTNHPPSDEHDYDRVPEGNTLRNESRAGRVGLFGISAC